MIDIADLARYPDPLCVELRKAIAELHGCEIENVFAGNGSDEVLALCIRAFVERDGSVGYFDPSYSLYPILADIEDVEKRPVALDAAFDWQMPEAYSASLFFLTNPNAPTSLQYSKSNVESFAKDFNGVVLIDEAYADFAAENCMDLALQNDNVLVARTLSKSYSLAGIRLGYCVGNAELIGALYKIKDSYNVNYLTQEIARVAIIDQNTMHANVEAIMETRKLVADKLSELGFEAFDSETPSSKRAARGPWSIAATTSYASRHSTSCTTTASRRTARACHRRALRRRPGSSRARWKTTRHGRRSVSPSRRRAWRWRSERRRRCPRTKHRRRAGRRFRSQRRRHTCC